MHSTFYPFLMEGLRSEKYMWFIESDAESLPEGLQTSSLCSRSLPLEDSLGTTWAKVRVGWYSGKGL